jgi:TetR/AcrR family transcriptional repressor of nem operon
MRCRNDIDAAGRLASYCRQPQHWRKHWRISDVAGAIMSHDIDAPVLYRFTSPSMTDHTTVALTGRGRATHARIVGAAAHLIYCRGLSNTTVNDVREAATVSGSQIAHYFSDKRALVRGVIGWRRDELVGFHTNGQLVRLDSFQALQVWADLNVKKQVDLDCAGGCTFGSLVGEVSGSDDDVRADLSAVYDEWIALFRTALAAMQRRGELRADADPRHLARVLVAAHQGGSLLTQTTRSIKPLRDALNAAVQYVGSFAAEPLTRTKRRTAAQRRALGAQP